MNIYWSEIKRLIKDNYKKILILTLIIASAFIALVFIRNVNNNTSDEKLEETSEVFDNETSPGYFRFYVEYPDGDTFTNVALIDSILNSDTVYDELKSDTRIDINELIEEAQEAGADESFQPLKVTLDSSSNVFTVIADTGSNRNNLRVANFYYNYIFEDRISVLQNNQIYELVAPALFEEEAAENDEEIDETQTLPGISIRSLIFTVFFGLFIGFSLTLVFVVLTEIFGKKLNYSFSYYVDKPSKYILLNNKNNNNDQKLLSFFIGDSQDSILLVEENGTEVSEKIRTVSHENEANIYTSLVEADMKHKNDMQQVVIVVVSSLTSRKWYNEQIKLCDVKGIHPEIVQINLEGKSSF